MIKNKKELNEVINVIKKSVKVYIYCKNIYCKNDKFIDISKIIKELRKKKVISKKINLKEFSDTIGI